VQNPEKAAQRAAIVAHARRATIPIVGTLEDSGAQAVQGSGVLYKARGKHMLVTATHVADSFIEGKLQLGLPAGKALAEPVGHIALPAHSGDVSVIVLPEPYVEVINGCGYWDFVDGDADIDREHDNYSEYVILGYPTAANRVGDSHVDGTSLSIHTRLYEGPTDGVASSAEPREWDVLFSWPPMGVKEQTPGISGGGVWGIRETNELWTPSRALRPVAVETSVVPGRWIRATAWDAVRLLIDNIPPV
jgi:hypothetical protein